MIQKKYCVALAFTCCLLPTTTRTFAFYEVIPYGALAGAIIAALTTDYEDASLGSCVEKGLTNAAAGAVAGSVLTALGGAGAKILGCCPSEEQRHHNRLEEAERVYNDAYTFTNNTSCKTCTATRNRLHRYYINLINKKVTTSKHCRRLFQNKTLPEEVRYTLQERYDNVHAKLADLTASYKDRLDELYGNTTDWPNTPPPQLRYRPTARSTYRLVQRAAAPRVTMRIGVRHVSR